MAGCGLEVAIPIVGLGSVIGIARLIGYGITDKKGTEGMIATSSVSEREGRRRRLHAAAVCALSLAVVLGTSISAEAKDKKKTRYKDTRNNRRVAPKQAGKARRGVPGLAGTGDRTVRPGQTKGSVQGPHPVIEAIEPVHDFGTVWIGPKLNHTFEIRNAGDKPLEITRVKPSCGCTVAGNYPRKLEPGQNGEFPFAVASTKLRGRFQKSITVTSNDPVTPDLRLQLKGEVKRYVDVAPAHANFGKIIRQEKQTRILNITNNTDKKLTATVTPTADGKFTYDLIETEPGEKYELRVAANPPFVPGNLRSRVTLKTSIEEQPEIRIFARAAVPARLDLQPSVIALRNRPSRARSGRGIARVVRFTNYGTTPVNVLDASVDDPDVKTTVNERTKGKAYTVLIQFPPQYKVPMGGKTLTINTDDKEQPELRVEIRGPRRRTASRKRPAEEMVGQRAPSFSTTTTAGKSLSNAGFKDQVTVLDFFAVNCGFCKKQIPRLETVRQQYQGKPVRFVAVAETMRKRYPESAVQAKIDELGFEGELVMDLNNNIGPAFKATSFPTMVVIDKNGKIAAVNVGNVGDLESRLKTQLDALIMGKPIPKIAKAKPKKKKPQRKQPQSLIGKSAPAFSASTLEGKSFSAGDFAKHPATVMDFFAVNCGYCKKQIPRVEAIRQKYEDKGIRFVAVSQKMRKEYSKDDVVKKLDELGFKGEVVVDHTNSIGQKFNARGFPTMVIVGKDGKVGGVNVGNLGDLEKRLGQQLDAALAGKPFPKYADAKPKSRRRRPAEELVGKAAPPFSLTTVGGKAIGNDDFKKHPATVLNFVAPNCGFCKRAIPNVEKVRKEYESKGIRFVNVAQKMRKEYPIDETVEIFEKAGSNLEIAKDDGNRVGRQYKAVSFPTMIVVDKNGKIANVNIGAKRNLESLLKSQLDALIKKAG